MRRFAVVALSIAALAFSACGDESQPEDDVTGEVTQDAGQDTTGDTAVPDTQAEDVRDVAAPDADATDAAGDNGDVVEDLPPFENGAYARVIQSETDLIGGPMAAGAIGDIVIGNKNVRFIVRNQEIGLYSPSPGSIVDVDVVRPEGEAGRDKFLELFPMIGFGRVLQAQKIEIIDDGAHSGTAVVRLTGFDHGMPIIDMLMATFPYQLTATMDYVLGPESTELRIDLTVTNNASYEQEVEIGAVVQFGRRLEYFYHQCGSDKTCLTGRKDVDWMAAGSDDVSYAFTGAPGVVSKVVLAEEQLLLTETSLATLASGASTSSSQYLIAGSGTIDEVAKRAWEIRETTGLRTVNGTISLQDSISDIRNARVYARKQGATGAIGWYDASQPDADGKVTLHLPDGVWDLKVTLPGAPDATAQVAVAENDTNTFEIQANAAGSLQVTVNDGDGNLLPAAVIVKDGDDAAPTVPGEFHAVRGGSDSFPLLPGKYTVMAMKGMEWSIASQNATVNPGHTTHVLFSLDHQIATPGQITTTSHDHSEMSIDAATSLVERVHDALACGIDYPVLTDHDYFINLQPYIEAEGAADLIRSTMGIEISPLGFHMVGLNCTATPAYPTYFAITFGAYDDTGYLSSKYTVNEIIDEARNYGCQYVGAAHPWEGSAIFNYAGLTPTTDPADVAGELDVAKLDGLELMNGDDNWGNLNSMNLAGWFDLLDHGYNITAVGGADMDDPDMTFGHPLNLVSVSSDNPVGVAPADLYDAIKAGHTLAYGGPYVTIECGGKSMGDLIDASDVPAPTIHIAVDGPDWMKIEFVKLYANGQLVQDTDISAIPGSAHPRAAIVYEPQDLAEDTYYVVVAGSATEESRMPGYGRLPVSVTNPIYLDADGDGWEAPLAH